MGWADRLVMNLLVLIGAGVALFLGFPEIVVALILFAILNEKLNRILEKLNGPEG